MSDAQAVVVGGGPAGLMAAEMLTAAGIGVSVYDAMPSVGRKFLLAGIGGMNITHAEPPADFVRRYRERAATLRPMLDAFPPAALREWIHALGIETFVGSSGRVFPKDMKAAPLLRAWLHRLRARGVAIHTRHRWLGWNENGALRFMTSAGETNVEAAVTVLALGGGSWPKLGSDGAWAAELRRRDVAVAPLEPANCGFDVAWSAFMRERFAGSPVKPAGAAVRGSDERRKGEFIVTSTGIEGGLVYALSAPLRDAVKAQGHAVLELDLLPDRTEADIVRALSKPRGARSLSEHLRRQLGLKGVKAALLREAGALPDEPRDLARHMKALPLRIERPRPLEEAISSAGGVRFDALDEYLMLKKIPGTFCAGEMLDWEAPTGGYLLTACFASGRRAGEGAVRWLRETMDR